MRNHLLIILLLVVVCGCARTRVLPVEPAPVLVAGFNRDAARGRARVTTLDGRELVVRGLRLDAGSLRWRDPASGRDSTVSLGEVRTVQYANIVRGAATGAAVGLLPGLALTPFGGVAALVGLGLPGALAGGLLGAATGYDCWRTAGEAVRPPCRRPGEWSVGFETGTAKLHTWDTTARMTVLSLRRSLGEAGLLRVGGEAAWSRSTGDDFVLVRLAGELHPLARLPISPFASLSGGLLGEPEFFGVVVAAGAGVSVRPVRQLALRASVAAGEHGGVVGPSPVALGAELYFDKRE